MSQTQSLSCPPLPAADAPSANTGPLLLALGLFAALSAAAAFSKGFLEMDGVCHYLISRFALRHPDSMLGVWGRPLVTTLYAWPAFHLGVRGVRFTSLVLALVSAIATWRIAVGQRHRWPAVAPILLLVQPLFFMHSFSELTEMPFLTLLVLAFWAYQSRQFFLMALLVSLGPTGRPEGFGFILLAAIALVAHRRARWLFVLPLPLLAWSLAGWLAWEKPNYNISWLPIWLHWLLWLPHEWPYSGSSPYGRGPLLSYAARLPMIVSPIVLPFFLAGVWLALAPLRALAARLPVVVRRICSLGVRRNVARVLRFASKIPGTLLQFLRQGASPRDDDAHRRGCDLIVLGICALIFVVHSILRWRGWQASSGELRYMLVAGPFWALVGARGWEWAFTTFGWRRPIGWTAVAAAVPLAVLLIWHVVPIPTYEDDRLAKQVGDWYGSHPKIKAQYPRLMPACVTLNYYLDVWSDDPDEAPPRTKQTVAHPPRGCLMIWDSIYGTTNADASLCVSREEVVAGGWIKLRDFTEGQRTWEAYLSPQAMDGTPTTEILAQPGAEKLLK